MKTFNTNQRTSDLNLLGNKYKLPQVAQRTVYNTLTKSGELNTVEEFIDMFPPVKPSIGLVNAIKTAWKNDCDVTYNCGNGNQTFYFNKYGL